MQLIFVGCLFFQFSLSCYYLVTGTNCSEDCVVDILAFITTLAWRPPSLTENESKNDKQIQYGNNRQCVRMQQEFGSSNPLTAHQGSICGSSQKKKKSYVCGGQVGWEENKFQKFGFNHIKHRSKPVAYKLTFCFNLRIMILQKIGARFLKQKINTCCHPSYLFHK